MGVRERTVVDTNIPKRPCRLFYNIFGLFSEAQQTHTNTETPAYFNEAFITPGFQSSPTWTKLPLNDLNVRQTLFNTKKRPLSQEHLTFFPPGH